MLFLTSNLWKLAFLVFACGILHCTQGLSNKHYERLIQCDKHLNLVSQHPDLVLDSPYFDVQASAKGSPTSSFNDVESTPAAQSSSEIGQNSVGLVPGHLSPQAPSPSSVMDLRAIEGNESRGGNGLQAQQSMSTSDIVNHIGHKISGRMSSGNASGNEETIECDDQDMPENIAQILLGDTQCPAASDEKKPSPTDNILRWHCIKNLSCYTQISTLREYISNKALLINCRGKPNFITDITVNFPAK